MGKKSRHKRGKIHKEDLLKMNENQLLLLAADPKKKRIVLLALDRSGRINKNKVMYKYERSLPTKKQLSVEYRKYIKSPEWKEFRKIALEAASHRCERCNHKGTRKIWLEVHHRHYNTFKRETIADVEVLCKPCHDMQHGK